MVRKFGELVDVAFDSADESAHLREDFVDVGRNFRHGTGENVDVVVAVHFEFAEFGPERSVARCGAGKHLRRRSGRRRERTARGIDAIEFVFFLELGDFALQTFFGETERVAKPLEFVTRPSMRVRLMTSSPTVFIMRSRRESAMRTDLTAAAAGNFSRLSERCSRQPRFRM